MLNYPIFSLFTKSDQGYFVPYVYSVSLNVNITISYPIHDEQSMSSPVQIGLIYISFCIPAAFIFFYFWELSSSLTNQNAIIVSKYIFILLLAIHNSLSSEPQETSSMNSCQRTNNLIIS